VKTWFFKAVYFLHISDGKGQLDLTDLSFVAIIVKLMFARNMDWGAVCTMIPILALQMHQNHIEYLSSKFKNNEEKKTE
jgi:hypothetical protein